MIDLIKVYTGEDMLNPVTPRYQTSYPVRNHVGYPVKIPYKSRLHLFKSCLYFEAFLYEISHKVLTPRNCVRKPSCVWRYKVLLNFK